MFSGKSEELIRRLRRAKIARQKVQVFKPVIDVRYAHDQIVSHSEMRHESSTVSTAAELRAKVEQGTEVVGIDEGQFFDNELVEVANELADRGLRVIIAGLDQDYTGKPFERCRNSYHRRVHHQDHAICMLAASPPTIPRHLSVRRASRRRRRRHVRSPLPPLLCPACRRSHLVYYGSCRLITDR